MRPLHFISILLPLTILSCLKEPCDNTMCLNGGVCTSGLCDCPDNFTGPSCAEQREPDYIRITSVKLTKFPEYLRSSLTWDAEDGPDIFFRLMEGDRPLAQPMILYENAVPGEPYYFFINVIDMHEVTTPHRLQLYDYDGYQADHALMGEVSFTPYHDDNGFPANVVVENGLIGFELTYEYFHSTNGPDLAHD